VTAVGHPFRARLARGLVHVRLGEVHRHGGGACKRRQERTEAERHGDRDGAGFVDYQRATDRGLVNQGWKDSFDAISFASGQLAEPPIALAEVQGYVYAAYLARAHLAHGVGEEDLARHWTTKAADLKRAFNQAFWLPDRGFYALALDAAPRPAAASRRGT